MVFPVFVREYGDAEQVRSPCYLQTLFKERDRNAAQVQRDIVLSREEDATRWVADLLMLPKRRINLDGCKNTTR